MKLINFFLFFILISINFSLADINKEFENWKLNFKKIALENNISEKKDALPDAEKWAESNNKIEVLILE